MTHLSITFPVDLKLLLDREAKKEGTKRSTLIQRAVRVYLDMKKRQKLHEAMKQGYLESSAVDKKGNKEWDSTLSDGLE